jgi:hypothetical protein
MSSIISLNVYPARADPFMEEEACMSNEICSTEILFRKFSWKYYLIAFSKKRKDIHDYLIILKIMQPKGINDNLDVFDPAAPATFDLQ